MRFAQGDIVVTGNGWRPACYIITAIRPDRPKNAYDGRNVLNGKTYRLCDASLTKIGTAASGVTVNGTDFLATTPVPIDNVAFIAGKHRAEIEAKFGNSQFRQAWKILAEAKSGDQLKLINGKTVTFRHVLAKGQRYVFVATKATGTNYRFPLSVLSTPAGPKRTEAEILEDLQDVESQLSPENLTCDGELSRSQVQVRYRQLMADKARLIQELGRTPTDAEVFVS